MQSALASPGKLESTPSKDYGREALDKYMAQLTKMAPSRIKRMIRDVIEKRHQGYVCGGDAL